MSWVRRRGGPGSVPELLTFGTTAYVNDARISVAKRTRRSDRKRRSKSQHQHRRRKGIRRCFAKKKQRKKKETKTKEKGSHNAAPTFSFLSLAGIS